MLRRILVLGGAIAVLAAAPAFAYPAPTGTGTVDNANPTAGGTVNVSGTGFNPGSSVIVTVCNDNNSFTVTAGSDGSVNTPVTVPASTPAGPCLIKLVGTDPNGANHVLGIQLTVKAAGGTPLPSTGSDTATPLWWGAGLVGAGIVLVALTRLTRQRRHVTTSSHS